MGEFTPAERAISNFITPPDYIETVLIIGASNEEIMASADACQISGKAYNVYVYDESMNDKAWLNMVMFKVDAILLQENQLQFTVPKPIGFGPNCDLQAPADYFTK
jgi:hypothetical protein